MTVSIRRDNFLSFLSKDAHELVSIICALIGYLGKKRDEEERIGARLEAPSSASSTRKHKARPTVRRFSSRDKIFGA